MGWLYYQRLRMIIQRKVLFFAAWLYIIFNLLAVLCNVFGRLTLAQIFGYTSVYTFAQIISLTVFIQSLEGN